MLLLSFMCGVMGGVLIGVIRKHNRLAKQVQLMEATQEIEVDAMNHVFAMIDILFDNVNPPVKKAKKGLTKGKK